VSKAVIDVHSERAQTMAEYVVVLGVITVAIVASFSALSGAILRAFERVLGVVGLAF
jgi:Flp pilus assembly pilin Flp